MAEEIKVSPTPIQRNLLDVATELTKLYYETHTPSDVEEVKNTYSEFYKTVVEEYRRR
jgi:hypothetical protein